MTSFEQLRADAKEAFGTGTSVSAGSRDGGGTLWATYYDGVEEDLADIQRKEDVWDDEFDHNPAKDYTNGRRESAASAYNRFLEAWNGETGFARDLELAEHQVDKFPDYWKDYVHKGTKSSGEDTRASKLLQSWYGPGAQAYAQVLQKQTTAMVELAALVEAAISHTETIAATIDMIGVAAVDAAGQIEDSITDYTIQGDIADHWVFGVRADMGADSLENLADWIEDLKSGGSWKDTMSDLETAMEDSLSNAVSFKDDKWPEAKVDDLGDMQNGNGGLGDQTQQQPPPATTQPPPTQAPTTPEEQPEVETQGGEQFPD